MKVNSQKRMAAEILKCGLDKGWIDPYEMEEASKATTKDDVRRLINKDVRKKRRSN